VKEGKYYFYNNESNISEEKTGDEFSISFNTCVEIKWKRRIT
jgi:hypothetical protein